MDYILEKNFEKGSFSFWTVWGGVELLFSEEKFQKFGAERPKNERRREQFRLRRFDLYIGLSSCEVL